MFTSKRAVESFLVLILFVVVGLFTFQKNFNISNIAAVGPTVKHLSGYAWSSNIGWISFRGTNPDYGVDYDSISGNLSGYAWSSNIGWISFESASVAGCPGGGACAPTLTNNSLSGFARACSVFESGCRGALKDQFDLGGWDGWISLSGIVYDTNTKEFSGYAWGGGSASQFPGWINWSGLGTLGEAYKVKIDDSPELIAKVACTRTALDGTPAYPIVGKAIIWTAETSSGFGYVWSVNKVDSQGVSSPAKQSTDNGATGDYFVIGGSLTSPSVTIKYLTYGHRTTDVQVTVNGSPRKCDPTPPTDITDFIVSDRDFVVNHSPSSMTARFIRSIKTVTVPDITISIVPNEPGFTPGVLLSFVKIEGIQDNALEVEPQRFWINGVTPVVPTETVTLTSAGGIYSTATLRLNLTKNQGAGDIPLPSGNYKVIIGALGGGIYKTHPIDINIDNPSGGVIER